MIKAWATNKKTGFSPEDRVEKHFHSDSVSVRLRAADFEQDSHRDKEKWSAVTQDGLTRATTSRQRARKMHSRAISLNGRHTYTSLTDIFSYHAMSPCCYLNQRPLGSAAYTRSRAAAPLCQSLLSCGAYRQVPVTFSK